MQIFLKVSYFSYHFAKIIPRNRITGLYVVSILINLWIWTTSCTWFSAQEPLLVVLRGHHMWYWSTGSRFSLWGKYLILCIISPALTVNILKKSLYYFNRGCTLWFSLLVSHLSFVSRPFSLLFKNWNTFLSNILLSWSLILLKIFTKFYFTERPFLLTWLKCTSDNFLFKMIYCLIAFICSL